LSRGLSSRADVPGCANRADEQREHRSVYDNDTQVDEKEDDILYEEKIRRKENDPKEAEISQVER
jgi:hypothetical protein